MARNYDISKKSDMKRFERDLKKKAEDMARDHVKKKGIDVQCPSCKRKFNAKTGNVTCPGCDEKIEVQFN